ncbi:MAG: hypothetical protein ACXWQR_22040 [Ktedonobacterales bacterium]
MVLDVSRSSGSTATMTDMPAKVLAADPWDAPYFGGPVYFEYRPARPAVMDAHAAWEAGASDDAARVVEAQMETAGALPADPWDAPYFGGPVYFRYADSGVKGFAPAALETAAMDGVEGASIVATAEVDGSDGGEKATTAVPGESGDVLAVAGAPHEDDGKRRGWLARLFRRELYIGRRA